MAGKTKTTPVTPTTKRKKRQQPSTSANQTLPTDSEMNLQLRNRQGEMKQFLKGEKSKSTKVKDDKTITKTKQQQETCLLYTSPSPRDS